MRCESPEALKTAVRNGAGVGILFSDAIREEVRRNEFAVVKLAGIELKSRSYILYSKKKPLSTAAQEFLMLLRASRNIHPLLQGELSTIRFGNQFPTGAKRSLSAGRLGM